MNGFGPHLDALIVAARRDLSDADTCVALGITPASHQLHRRLREIVVALSAEQNRVGLIAESSARAAEIRG